MRPNSSFALHAILAAALTAFAATSAAAADAYLKFGTIKGEAPAREGGKDWIEIDSYQWGQTRGVSGGTAANREASSPSVSEIAVTKQMDKATPKLAQPLARGSMGFRGQIPGCAVGTSYPSATLETRFHKYEFKDVIITSCALSSMGGGGGGGSSQPMEEISFNYTKVQTLPIKQDRKDGDKPYRPKWDTPKPELK